MLRAIVPSVLLAGCGSFLSVPTITDGDAGPEASALGSEGPGAGQAPNGPRDAAGGGSNDAAADALPDADASAGYVYVPSAGAASWTDSFARSDGPDPGNGWFDKTPGLFALTSGHVTSQLVGGLDTTFAMRPQTEKQLNVEVSATFTLANAIESAYLVARVLDLSENQASGSFTGYLLRVASPVAEIALSEQLSPTTGTYAQLNEIGMTPALVVGHPYRAFLRVTGSDTVLIEGGVFEIGSTTPIVSLRGTDPDSYRILTAGRVGFAARQPGTTFDDFERRDLP